MILTWTELVARARLLAEEAEKAVAEADAFLLERTRDEMERDGSL